jgi:hypothetical protein
VDGQQVEILGRGILIQRLVEAGVEVARPERDYGVDLIAYLDREIGGFCASPIQMKSTAGATFSLDRKYESIPGLLLAYVWDVGQPGDAAVYLMSYAEAFGVAEEMGWHQTSSWAKGSYTATRVSAKLRDLIARYAMTPERIHALVRQSNPSREAAGITSTWLSDAADASRMEAEFGSDDASRDPVRSMMVDDLATRIGSDVALVVRDHEDGLGPCLVVGRMNGLVDTVGRPYGRLRPSPAFEIVSEGRRVVVPVGLILEVRDARQLADLDWRHLYDFSALTPDDSIDGRTYRSMYPQG